jgi:hypothetical protein
MNKGTTITSQEDRYEDKIVMPSTRWAQGVNGSSATQSISIQ